MLKTKLIGKEFFALNPSILVAALCFGLMPMMFFIPHYPSIVAMCYIFFQVQISFESFKASKDVEFMLTLPVRREEIVKSRFFVVMFFQAVMTAVAIPCALVACYAVFPLGQIGMDTNFAFFGFVFIYYGIFNFTFLSLHFKTAYKWGAALVIALCVVAVTVVCAELLIGLVPVLKSTLDSLELSTMIYRLLMLAFGAAFYAGANYLGYKVSVKRFGKIDV